MRRWFGRSDTPVAALASSACVTVALIVGCSGGFLQFFLNGGSKRKAVFYEQVANRNPLNIQVLQTASTFEASE